MYRRQSILECLNSLQSHFLRVYTSGKRQCKLGYDSSAQCDSFQLGEMVRFLTRVRTLRLQGLVIDPTDLEVSPGSIPDILGRLRQCSSYQINSHHVHCGLRARLIPLLNVVQRHVNPAADVCGKCWASGIGWTHQAPVERWACRSPTTSNGDSCAQHERAREMFTAEEREWEPEIMP